jgi:hypothetical protein
MLTTLYLKLYSIVIQMAPGGTHADLMTMPPQHLRTLSAPGPEESRYSCRLTQRT